MDKGMIIDNVFHTPFGQAATLKSATVQDKDSSWSIDFFERIRR